MLLRRYIWHYKRKDSKNSDWKPCRVRWGFSSAAKVIAFVSIEEADLHRPIGFSDWNNPLDYALIRTDFKSADEMAKFLSGD